MDATVLFVDDDMRLIRLYAEAIDRAGLRSRCVHGPDDALAYLERGEPAQVIVWDMMMLPGRAFAGVDTEGGTSTGRFLYQRMRQLRPDAAFVLLSDQSFDLRSFELPEARSFGRFKPDTNPEELAELVESLVEGGQGNTSHRLRSTPPPADKVQDRWRRLSSDTYERPARLERIRCELSTLTSPVEHLFPLQNELVRLGNATDVRILRDLLERRPDLGEQLAEATAESIRRLQEKDEALLEIDGEERALAGLLSPLATEARWVALRLGKPVAEGDDRESVAAAIEAVRERGWPHYHATLLSLEQRREIEATGLVADDAELWRFVRDRALVRGARLRALDELIKRDNPEVPRFAVEELERRHGVDARFQQGLLVSTERMSVRDPELRLRLTQALFDLAFELRDGREKEETVALWAALRSYAALVPAADAWSLLSFLGDELPRPTHQVVFQCIAGVFQNEPPADDAPLDALRERVVVLSLQYLAPAFPLSGEEISLALAGFVAAAALGSEELGVLEERLSALPEPWLADEARRQLEALAARWRRRALRLVDESCRRLQRHAGRG